MKIVARPYTVILRLETFGTFSTAAKSSKSRVFRNSLESVCNQSETDWISLQTDSKYVQNSDRIKVSEFVEQDSYESI